MFMFNNMVEESMLRISCNILIHDSMVLWYQSKGESFINCFKKTMEIRGFEWTENGKVIDLSTGDALIRVIDALNTTIIAQIACYAYEIANTSKDDKKSERVSFREKDNIFVSDDISNDYQLLNFIRNAISHNNDMDDELRYAFSQSDRSYTFSLNKEGSENSKVVIGKKELVNFLSDYIISLNCLTASDNLLGLNFKNIYSQCPITDVEKFIELKNRETGQSIAPDENQSKIISDIVNYLRKNRVEDHKCVKFCYPYKQNVLNNYFRMYDFYYLITGLYSCRNYTYSKYMKYMLDYGTFYDREIRQEQDIPGLFIINRMFQIFSTTNNSVLDHTKNMFDFNRFNKLRNSIMHGTYYKDFYGTFYFYDAPRDKKNEEKLKFIDKLSIEEFRLMERMFKMAKRLEKESKMAEVSGADLYDNLYEIIKRKMGF